MHKTIELKAGIKSVPKAGIAKYSRRVALCSGQMNGNTGSHNFFANDEFYFSDF